PVVRPGGQGSIANFLRAIELVQHQQRLVAFFLEGHRRDGAILATLLVRPDDSRVRRHLEVRAEERHRVRAIDVEHETVAASNTPTCFFMPVRVMWNFPARSVIEASERPSCSRTPRRVASESAANESSSRACLY